MARTTLLLLVVASFLVQLFSTVPPAAATSRMLEEQQRQARFFLVGNHGPGYFLPWPLGPFPRIAGAIGAGLSAAAGGIHGFLAGAGDHLAADHPDKRFFINGATLTAKVGDDSRSVHDGYSAGIHHKGDVVIPLRLRVPTSITILSGNHKGDVGIHAVQDASGNGLRDASGIIGNAIGHASESSSADSNTANPVKVVIVSASRGSNTHGRITNDFNGALEDRKVDIQPKREIGANTVDVVNRNHGVGNIVVLSSGRNTADTKDDILSRDPNNGGIQVIQDGKGLLAASASKGSSFGDIHLSAAVSSGDDRNNGIPSKIGTDISAKEHIDAELTAISNPAHNMKAVLPKDGNDVSGSSSIKKDTVGIQAVQKAGQSTATSDAKGDSDAVVDDFNLSTSADSSNAEGDTESESNNVVAVSEINKSNGFHEEGKTGLPKTDTDVPTIDTSKGDHDNGDTGLSTVSDAADTDGPGTDGQA
ncbi:hypothetical protein ACP4OV_024485 [Aristida adscensionis]